MNKTLVGIEKSEVSSKGGIEESSGAVLYARQIHEGEYLNWLQKTILQLSHLFQIS